MDDEPLFRGLAVGVLRLHGFAVLEAEGRTEALRMARDAAVIHLLITDLAMPEVLGLELARQFRLVHAKTPVLILSGSSPETPPRVHGLDGYEFLAKPFRFEELVSKVHAVIGAAASLPKRKPWPEHR